MTPNLTGKPLHYNAVDSDLVIVDVDDLEKKVCNIGYAAFCIKGVKFTFLVVRMNELEETVCSALAIGILGAELLFGIGDFNL